MKAEDIPFFAALIFPGFFAIQAFFWATQSRDISDAMRVVWSFVYSVPVFFAVHGLSRHVFRVGVQELASPQNLAAKPAGAPLLFLVGLYLGGIVAGYLFGTLWRHRLLDRALQRVGLDLRRHRDVLSQALGQGSHLDLRLTGGTILRGWPFLYSTEGESERFVYLTRAHTWSGTAWERTADTLVPLDKIDRMSFVDPDRPLQTGEIQP